ncbi:putative sodium/phosphate symporter [Emericellopsis atlantica]|uniref:Phosphate transporter n=1 Tax=Emericellopsis atlantica TaxID=2614577 RepID=A0A9P8CQR4_9HYPO|nr:putative sodium/phosphate symporter [Emericellopsis atlantica]KAG9253996.1 putative sodium/phosphate symporter [Emericellopsis atlantica]
MVMSQFDYVFAIGTCFALLDAYNNGANDVANSWATSVSSRSISYRWAMLCALVFEFLGAVTVGARTASTIKDGIIPLTAFHGNAGVQMLAFTCALAGASSWVMFCSKNSVHVSSSYSLISAIAGVGVAVVGADQVQWGWNGGKGLGAIFAGLGMAPVISGGFGAIIFMMIKLGVHIRKSPVKWAIYTSPFFFFVAATVCTLSVVYKGSPNLGLSDKPVWYILTVTFACGGGVGALAAIFFVPFLWVRVVRKDAAVRFYMLPMGPLLLKRPVPVESEVPTVPDYAVIQKEDLLFDDDSTASPKLHDQGDAPGVLSKQPVVDEKNASIDSEGTQKSYKELQAEARKRFHARLYQRRGPLGWAMRFLRDNPMHDGEFYELKNLKTAVIRLPALLTVALLYGVNYDIHSAQTGIAGTPEGRRMERVYAQAEKYSNEVEHTYSFVQILTACTASFAHGANDIGNSVGPWAVIYATWKTGVAVDKKATVPVWQLAVLALTLCAGLATYGYNIMKVMGNKITYHSPSRGCSMELGAAITVLIFSQYHLPTSTSMCITGATVGVGLCNGKIRAVNWQRVGLLLTGWIFTIPIAGTLAGCLMGLVINAPHF